MFCPTSGRRSPVNAPSLLTRTKSHPFQTGKQESFAFALCLKPRDTTNKKSAHFQQRGTSAALARKLLGRAQHVSHHQAEVGDATEAQQFLSVHNRPAPLVNNSHVHTRQAAYPC